MKEENAVAMDTDSVEKKSTTSASRCKQSTFVLTHVKGALEAAFKYYYRDHSCAEA